MAARVVGVALVADLGGVSPERRRRHAGGEGGGEATRVARARAGQWRGAGREARCLGPERASLGPRRASADGGEVGAGAGTRGGRWFAGAVVLTMWRTTIGGG